MTELLSTLTQQIRAARFRANLTQEEFARNLKVSARTVQNWESGAAVPRPSHRRRLAKYLAEREGGLAA